MRTNIKIVGLGQRKAGTSSKSGRPYDFIPVSFVFPDTYTEGYKAATSLVDGSMLDAIGSLKLNDEREAFFHYAGNSVVIDGIL